jgi:hypothetical protein
MPLRQLQPLVCLDAGLNYLLIGSGMLSEIDQDVLPVRGAADDTCVRGALAAGVYLHVPLKQRVELNWRNHPLCFLSRLKFFFFHKIAF